MNYKRILLFTFILLHVVAIILIGIYAYQTNSISSVEIISETKAKIEYSTPKGNSIVYEILPRDTLLLSKRPWKSIEVTTLNNKYNLDLKSSETNTFIQKKDLKYKIINRSKNKYFGVIAFAISMQKLVIPAYLLFLTVFLILIIFMRQDKRITFSFFKNKIFRWLLKSKTNKSDNLIRPIKLKTHESIWALFLTVFIIIALFLNLEKYPFGQKSEEKRRALVSLEMKISGDYLVPTTNGEKYYNKPPLFNWLLLPVIQNENVESHTRTISVSILILASLSIFLVLYKKRGWHHALMVILLFIGSWHVMSYVSFVINVDGLFALFLILIFYINYYLALKKKYLKMYLIGYMLFALAFLTKGFPAIWFFYLSLFSSLIIHKNWRILFSWKHLAGLTSAIVILGLYWGFYATKADPLPYLKQLINELFIGNKYTLLEKIKHIITFPTRNLISYLPATLLLPLLFFKKSIIGILKNKELAYLCIIIFGGSFAFLSSPYFLPYYILMLLPLSIDLFLHFIPSFKEYTIKESLKMPIILIVLFIPYWMVNQIDNFWGTIIIILLAIMISLLRKHSISLFLLMITIIVFIKTFGDMGYYTDNFDFNTPTREDCERIISKYPEDVSILQNKDLINYVSVFYLTYFSDQIIPLVDTIENQNKMYLTTNPKSYTGFKIQDSIQQYIWTFNPNKKSKGVCIYKPLYLIRKNDK